MNNGNKSGLGAFVNIVGEEYGVGFISCNVSGSITYVVPTKRSSSLDPFLKEVGAGGKRAMTTTMIQKDGKQDKYASGFEFLGHSVFMF